MSQRLFNIGKIGLFLDAYKGGTEKRKGGAEKVIVMTLRAQPFDAKLAASIDAGVGDESNVRATLFKLNHPDPKPHVDRVNFMLGCPRQTVEIFASPDTPEARIVFDHVKISGTYARTEKNVNGYAFVFTATYGPAGREELEFAHEWLGTQRFITFQEAAPLLDYEEDGSDEEEGTDQDQKARRPAPMFETAADGEPIAAPESKSGPRQVKDSVNRKLHSHANKKASNPRAERSVAR